MATETANKVAYQAKVDWIEACNCQHGCNCQFGGYPNEGKCEFLLGFVIKEGHYGDVSMNGVRAAVAMQYPKAIHEGNGHVVLFVDDKATAQQAEAFTAIITGRAGGMPFEALAGTVGRFEGPVRKPVEIVSAKEHSKVHVPGAIDLQLTPLRDPVSGKDKEVHITYPKGGFFWNDANIATTQTMRAHYGDLKFEWPGKYAGAAEANWTNQK
jgi:hypothetical protein